jgi:hypothetical protein
MSTGRSSRKTLVWLAAAWPILVLAGCLLLSDLEKVVTTYLSDDGFFYLTIARNWASGIPSSFSGIDRTNGYHPLWAWILVPLTGGFHGLGDASVVRMVILVQLVQHGCSAALLNASLPGQTHAAQRSLILSVFAFLCVLPSWYGLEVPLAISLFLWFWLAAVRGRALQAALAAGGLILCRLDAALIVAPLLALLAWRARESGSGVSRWSVPVLVPAVIIAPYLVWNLAAFGHLLPISGALKSSFPYPRIINLPWNSVRWLRLAAPLVLGGVALWGARRSDGVVAPSSGRLQHAKALFAGVCVFYVYECLFQRDALWAQFSWHFALPSAAACVLMGEVQAKDSKALCVGSVFVALASVGLIAVRFLPSTPGDFGHVQQLEAARWIDSRTARDAVVAATDPGKIAYFSGRRTISLDGLVNDYVYQEALREDRLYEYLRERDVAYVVVMQGRRYDHGQCTCYPLIGRLHEVEIPLCLPSSARVHTSLGDSIVTFRWEPLGERGAEGCETRGEEAVRGDPG